MPSPIQSLKAHVHSFQTKHANQQRKEAAANPDNPQALADLLKKAEEKHGTGNVTPCIKRTLFGTPYVSVNLPKSGKDAKKALRKFAYLLTNMGVRHMGTSTRKQAAELSSFTNAYRELAPEHLAKHTKAVEEQVRELANKKEAQALRAKAGTVEQASVATKPAETSPKQSQPVEISPSQTPSIAMKRDERKQAALASYAKWMTQRPNLGSPEALELQQAIRDANDAILAALTDQRPIKSAWAILAALPRVESCTTPLEKAEHYIHNTQLLTLLTPKQRDSFIEHYLDLHEENDKQMATQSTH